MKSVSIMLLPLIGGIDYDGSTQKPPVAEDLDKPRPSSAAQKVSSNNVDSLYY